MMITFEQSVALGLGIAISLGIWAILNRRQR